MNAAPQRTLVLWLPDWPVVALAREQGVDAAAPVAVLDKGAVVACSAAARAEGVRRGQRRRDAQARCPQLTIVDADPTRDQRVFAPLVASIEELAPGVQLIRAGLCALRAQGPARYYGGEERTAHVLRDALGDTDARIAVADGAFTAEQAARITHPDAPVRIVPAGESGAFLAPLPVTALDEADVVDLLARLGVHTLGQFAAMPAERVGERLGERGIRLHSFASGSDSRPVQPRIPPPELEREVAFEPPLEIADQVAFAMRVAAEEFIAGLGEHSLVCTELRVQITGDRGENSERVWLHPGAFTAGEVVDRVRWQLGEAGLRSAVTRVRISPETVDAASHHVRSLFGGGPDERVHHALSRVQAMLGHRGVVTPVVGGGRWLAERQVLVPWGDRPVLPRPADRPWPGSLPDPLPSTVFDPPRPVEVVDADGDAVAVADRDELTAPPAVLYESGRRRRIQAWAGPWPVRERGWDAVRARRAHRFQVVDADQAAWLLVCEAGDWTAEGRYD
ncbi:DNA polymerase Y family protein [Microbacterium sp. zg-YB36]|uniref:DNA polymerase Y family protein n=1 Tax=Microbacterium sp. zg-YB36 TaxID=2969407 RepID=UPI00214AC173|nr:DNA polymerase Y family protein [Microbacterium sp. zg-YB36]MDL5350955.1 DNA polymerase Y family protein [Microbacterium sp. zg-YB36]